MGGLPCCVRCSKLRDELGRIVAAVVGDDGGELREGEREGMEGGKEIRREGGREGREGRREGCESCSTTILIPNE